LLLYIFLTIKAVTLRKKMLKRDSDMRKQFIFMME
jgi:hypothetical protein